MAGSALLNQVVSSITKLGKAELRPTVENWQKKLDESNFDDFPPNRPRLEVIHETNEEDEDNSPPLIQTKDQQETTKVPQFSRPPSTHEDPSDGFTFTKPKIPQMNFFRISGSSNVDPNATKSLAPAHTPSRSNSSISSLGLTGTTSVAAVSKESTINGRNEISIDSSPLKDQAKNEVSGEAPAPNPARENANISRASHTSSNTNTPLTSNIRPQAPEVMEICQESFQPASEFIANGPTSQHVRPVQAKVNRASKRSHIQPENKSQPTLQHVDSGGSLNEEDLLTALLFRHRREQQNKDALRAAQHAKDLELEDLRDVSNELYRQLKAVQEQNKTKDIQLSKFHSIIPQWEGKVQKLGEHVENLMNNHQELRNGADEMKKQYESIQVDKSALNRSLDEVHEALNGDRFRTNKVFCEAKNGMKLLGQIVKDQEIQLQEDSDLLGAERARNHRLEDEIAKITKSHQELGTLIAGHKDQITDKLSTLIEMGSIAQNANISRDEHNLKIISEQFIHLVRKIQELEAVKPHDLQKLDTSIKIYAQGLTQSMLSCGRSSELTIENQKKFSLELQQQLEELKSNVKAEGVLNQQLMDTREMKATIKERLQMTEKALVEVRQRGILLENKEQLHVQKICALEIEVGKNSSKTPKLAELTSQIQELKIRNQDLQEQFNTCQKKANSESEQLQQKIEEASKLESSVATLELQLSKARIESSTLEDQRTALESKAVEELDQLRTELSKSALLEQDRLEADYLNKLQQLRHQNTVTEEKSENWRQQLDKLHCEKEAADGLANERLQLLNEAKAENIKNNENTEVCKTRIVDLEMEVEQGNKCLKKTQEELYAATLNLRTKEEEILKLKALTISKAGTDKEHNFLSLFESPKRKSHGEGGKTQPNTVIEDSQLDPKKSNPYNETTNQIRETSSVSSLEDLSELFPATPDLIPRAFDITDQRSVPRETGTSARHLTFAPGTSGGESHEHLNQTAAQLSEPKHLSKTPKALLQAHKTGRHDLILSQRHQSDIVVRSSQSLLRKPLAKIVKSDKRTASAAGLDEEVSQSRSSGSTRARGLGAVIPESQSPNGSRGLSARGRKIPKIAARKTSRNDSKFERRFSQELN